MNAPQALAWASAVAPGQRPGLDLENFQVVVQGEDLDVAAGRPLVAGHDRGAVEDLDAWSRTAAPAAGARRYRAGTE